MCMVKFERVEQFIGGFGGECVCWINVVKELVLKYDNLIGDVLIVVGVIVYFGVFIVRLVFGVERYFMCF